MKLYQLKYFTAVCNYGYVTKAAEELHVTQPSVSRAIKELEDEFAVNLVHRINNRPVSDTHLDVYKRQIYCLPAAAQRSWPTLPRKRKK